MDKDDSHLLALAAAVEQRSTDPLAEAIVRAAQARGIRIAPATHQQTLAGIGIRATVEGHDILLGALDRLPGIRPDASW